MFMLFSITTIAQKQAFRSDISKGLEQFTSANPVDRKAIINTLNDNLKKYGNSKLKFQKKYERYSKAVFMANTLNSMYEQKGELESELSEITKNIKLDINPSYPNVFHQLFEVINSMPFMEKTDQNLKPLNQRLSISDLHVQTNELRQQLIESLENMNSVLFGLGTKIESELDILSQNLTDQSAKRQLESELKTLSRNIAHYEIELKLLKYNL